MGVPGGCRETCNRWAPLPGPNSCLASPVLRNGNENHLRYWGNGPQLGIWAAPSPVGTMTGGAPWRVVT